MNTELNNVLESLYITYEIPYFYVSKNKELILFSSEQEKLILNNSESTNNLIHLCLQDKKGYMMINKLNIAIVGLYVEKDEGVLILGKVFLGAKSQIGLEKELFQRYGYKDDMDRALNKIILSPTFSEMEFIRIVRYINYMINNSILDETDFIIEACNNKKIIMTSDDDEIFYEKGNHNPYHFEEYLLKCIDQGETEKLESFLKKNYTGVTGQLVKNKTINPLRQIKNVFICACTIATRAAIKGGLNSELACSLSDYYIQNIEEFYDVNQVGRMVNVMFCDFATRVSKSIKFETNSKLINDCLSYINAHIRESIDSQTIANLLGVSKNHLLKKFKEETKTSFVEFVNNAKISEAKLLLQYSDLSIVEISEYLSFSSQSFFTSIFKSIEGITPKKFRDNQLK